MQNEKIYQEGTVIHSKSHGILPASDDPVFVSLYLHAETDRGYYIAAAVMGISSITDMFDGLVARKFNMITEFGKFLDPFADKMTHGAILLCLWTRYPYMAVLVILFVVKEGFMAVMGLVKLREGKKLDGAMWFGKVCTALLFVVMFVLILVPISRSRRRMH